MSLVDFALFFSLHVLPKSTPRDWQPQHRGRIPLSETGSYVGTARLSHPGGRLVPETIPVGFTIKLIMWPPRGKCHFRPPGQCWSSRQTL